MKNIDKSANLVNELFKNFVTIYCMENNVSLSKDLSIDAFNAIHIKLLDCFYNNLPEIYEECTDCLINLKELLKDFYLNCGNNFISIESLDICVKKCDNIYNVLDSDLIFLYGLIIRNNIVYFNKNKEIKVEETLNSIKHMTYKYDKKFINEYIESTRKKFYIIRDSYGFAHEFVDSNGKFIIKKFVSGDIFKLCDIGIEPEYAKKIVNYTNDEYLKQLKLKIDDETKQASIRKNFRNDFYIIKTKEPIKKTSLIALENDLNEYLDNDVPIKVLSDIELRKIQQIMIDMNQPSSLIRKRMEKIVKSNNEVKEEINFKKTKLISEILTEDERLIISQSKKLENSEYFKSYDVDKILRDIDYCIDELLVEELNKDYIEMLKQLVLDLKEKLLIINSINYYDVKEYKNV